MIENWQYLTGADPTRLSPDGYMLDIALMAIPDAEENQLDLIDDYRSNVKKYPAFLPAGAKAYNATCGKVMLICSIRRSFRAETHAAEIAAIMRTFLDDHL